MNWIINRRSQCPHERLMDKEEPKSTYFGGIIINRGKSNRGKRNCTHHTESNQADDGDLNAAVEAGHIAAEDDIIRFKAKRPRHAKRNISDAAQAGSPDHIITAIDPIDTARRQWKRLKRPNHSISDEDHI